MKCVRRLTLQEDNVVAEFIINVGQVPVGVNHRPPPQDWWTTQVVQDKQVRGQEGSIQRVVHPGRSVLSTTISPLA